MRFSERERRHNAALLPEVLKFLLTKVSSGLGAIKSCVLYLVSPKSAPRGLAVPVNASMPAVCHHDKTMIQTPIVQVLILSSKYTTHSGPQSAGRHWANVA